MPSRHGWTFPERESKAERFTADGFQMLALEDALRRVREPRVAVDGGAHIGAWTRRMLEVFDTVYAYEPCMETFKCLRRNARSKRLIARRAALGSVSGRAAVDTSRSTLSDHLVDGDEVDVVRLDDEGLPRLDLLKIDVEGYELFALIGAAQLIHLHRPVVVVEHKSHGLRYNVQPDDAIDWLSERGYRLAYRAKPDVVMVPSELHADADDPA